MRFRLLNLCAALAFLSGCSIPYYIPGGYEEGMPRLYDPIKECSSVWVVRLEKPASDSIYQRSEQTLADEFERCFGAHGGLRPIKQEDADVLVEIKVLAWEYNDAGFSGFRDRNHIELQVTLSNPKRKRILQRAYVHILNDFRIIKKYVDSLYKER